MTHGVFRLTIQSDDRGEKSWACEGGQWGALHAATGDCGEESAGAVSRMSAGMCGTGSQSGQPRSAKSAPARLSGGGTKYVQHSPVPEKLMRPVWVTMGTRAKPHKAAEQ